MTSVHVTEVRQTVEILDTNETVVVTTDRIQVVTAGTQGAQGIQGETGAQGWGIYAYAKVSSDGSIDAANGLSCVKSATGTYDYTFSQPYGSTDYAVFGQPIGSPMTDQNVEVTNQTANGFRIIIAEGDNSNTNDTPVDRAHSVLVVGISGETGVGSAYQSWLAVGNTGTEQEFLDSLVGAQGEQGLPGADGADGQDASKTWGDIIGTLSDQTDLQAALDAKASSSHTHTASEVTDFDTEVANNAAVASNTAKNSYPSADATKLAGIAAGATANDTDANLKNRANHTGSQAISTITGLQTALDSKSDTSHNHDTRYYTETETDALLNAKVAVSAIVNSLTSTATNQPLSAAQGKVLKDLIDTINSLLTSDETTLDTLQEIVDYIQLNRSDLDALSIASIAGLQAALDTKSAIGHTHTETDIIDLDKYTQSEVDALISAIDLTPYVPYTGATGDINIGSNTFKSGMLEVGSSPAYNQTRAAKFFDNGVQYGARASLIGTGDTGYPSLEFVTDGNTSKRTLIRHDGEGGNSYGLNFYTTNSGVVTSQMFLHGNGNLEMVGGGDIVTTGDVSVASEAYGGGWDANLTVPTKADIYDKLESLEITEAQITDLDKYTQAEVTSLLSGKANTSHTHSQYVPYTGASALVDIGAQSLKGGALLLGNNGLYDQTIKVTAPTSANIGDSSAGGFRFWNLLTPFSLAGTAQGQKLAKYNVYINGIGGGYMNQFSGVNLNYNNQIDTTSASSIQLNNMSFSNAVSGTFDYQGSSSSKTLIHIAMTGSVTNYSTFKSTTGKALNVYERGLNFQSSSYATLNTAGAKNYQMYGVQLSCEAYPQNAAGGGSFTGKAYGMYAYLGTNANIGEAYGVYVSNGDVSGSTTNYAIWTESGNWVMDGDNQQFFLGANQDSSLYFDGTDLIIAPDENASGAKLKVNGDVEVAGSINKGVFLIWAEEAGGGVNSGINSGYQWSYGNGDETPNSHGIVLPVACEAIAMSLNVENATATGTVELYKNTATTGESISITSGVKATNVDIATPVAFAAGDTLNFRSTASSGGSSARIAVLLRMT